MDKEIKDILQDVLQSNFATQRMVHEEMGVFNKRLEGIENIQAKMQAEIKEYHDMKLQAKGIIGLIRLLWNIGLIGILFAIVKKKLNVEF